MIAVVGAGKMGYALLYAMLQSKKFKESELVVADKSAERLALVSENFSVRIAQSPAEAAAQAEAVLLAVKPQDMQQLLQETSEQLKNKLVISIAAGLKISFYEKAVPTARVVRVMPNIACMVQQMAGAFAVGKKVTELDKELVARIFSSAGIIGEVKEGQLDAVTALSGSGPAFFAFFAKSLAEAAEKNGLGRQASAELAAQTMLGTAKMLQSDKTDAGQLIKSVSSPGGTTEAGLQKLKQRAVGEALSAAINAAVKRSRQLSKGG